MDFIFWILLILVVVYEIVALVTKRRGDTISEKAWSLRERVPPWGRIIVDSLIIWLAWHLIVDPVFFEAGAGWGDLVVIIVAALVSWKFLGPKE